jgi:methyl-accepting chemotaxis protein
MISRVIRGGIRTQITIMVLIGAVLTTGVTLLIAVASIQGYSIQQAQNQETSNMNVATLVLTRAYGHHVSVDYQGNLVIDSPASDVSSSDFGKLSLETDTSYVDTVRAQLNNVEVAVYQCADAQNTPKFSPTNHELCPRISTTFTVNGQSGAPREVDSTAKAEALSPNVVQLLGLQASASGVTATGDYKQYQETIDGVAYLSEYHVIYDPQNHLVAVLGVSEPLTDLNALINRTTLELIISGVVITLGGIILALLVASTISGTLQRAATQLGKASSQLTNIADAQAAGSRQQVWAINAINQALQNLQETSGDVSQRTEQLAQIGTQVAMRRAEIAPAQFESIMAYMTRSAGDISVASRYQTTTVERMASAMEAVVEIADQVSNSSQQTTASAKRLDGVIGELEQLVTGKTSKARTTKREAEAAAANAKPSGMNSGGMNSGGMNSGGMNSGAMRGGGMAPPQSSSRPRGAPMQGDFAATGNGMMAPGGRPGPGMMGPNGGGMMGPGNGPAGPGNGMAGPNGGMMGPWRGMPRSEPPSIGRPMLPSADRGQGNSRPRLRDQGGWDGDADAYGYGGPPPRPNGDQGRR